MQNYFLLNKIKSKIKKNTEIFALSLLIVLTISFTTYYNYSKKKIYNNYVNTINNVYLKKTITHIFDNLEPKFKKIEHQISKGETFQNILESYSIKKDDISEIKKILPKNININRLNTNQKIHFTIDQTDNSIKEFIFQISNKERIILTQDINNKNFSQEIVLTKLEKKIVYNENLSNYSIMSFSIDGVDRVQPKYRRSLSIRSYGGSRDFGLSRVIGTRCFLAKKSLSQN